MHACAAGWTGFTPRMHLLPRLAASLLLAFGILLWADEADARLAGSLGDLFSRPGLIGGFAAGFLGAGIFGLLFGHGLIGELSGVPSILGLLFQFALLVALGWSIWARWRADKSTAAAELSLRQLADAYERDRDAGLPELGPDAHGKPKVDGKNSFVGEARLPL
jgi:hypothetical protein